ncbi:flavodoxin [Litorilinea aerophila]|uniref:Flavodoxin n=1 Tax=Litorilinea aerophila TaxID=1204385 RepID=A0A540V8S2_9CHLR|nr:flavodoxin [Litorilinea aerophila]MCC9078890.1 flavodoxin [Litorilinea aerophila]
MEPIEPKETQQEGQDEPGEPVIGLFYGSTDGNTEAVAREIQACFARKGYDLVELVDVAEYYLAEMLEYDHLILGIPTWNVGQLQRDWEASFEELDELDLTGKQVAIFGLGDQVGYPDTFVDAMCFLAEKVEERGATLVGAWPTEGYHFRQSWAVREGRFMGLVLDELNQPELTPGRVEQWVEQLIQEFQLKRESGEG